MKCYKSAHGTFSPLSTAGPLKYGLSIIFNPDLRLFPTYFCNTYLIFVYKPVDNVHNYGQTQKILVHFN